MWSDNETHIDLLDFNHLVKAVLSVLHNRELLPATIGIFGDWGSGKSSLMQMIRAELRSDNKEGPILCISFNGWLFEGYKDAKTILMSTILQEIADNRKLGAKAKEMFGRLMGKVNLMHIALLAHKYGAAYALADEIGLGIAALTDLPDLAHKLAEKFKGVSEDEIKKVLRDSAKIGQDVHLSVRDFHNDFSKFLAETNIETLVVFIDDLDRCTPDTIIGTLEAIKLFLFAPQTVFILGADEYLVQHAVRRRFPQLPGDKAEVGRDYLEKLVQFPIRIPPLGHVELETYINLLFVRQVLSDDGQFESLRRIAINRSSEHLYQVTFNVNVIQEVLEEVPSELRERLALARYLAPILTKGLQGNPRQTKRFLNTLMMRMIMAESRNVELQLRVLAKLMLLEYFRPEAFQQLSIMQAEQDGRPKEIKLLEQQTELSNQALGNGDNSLDQDAEDADFPTQNDTEAKRPSRDDKISSAARRGTEQVTPLKTVLGDTLSVWLSDSWIKDWLSSEPSLSDCDLRPYFFFSRERLGVFTGSIQRLSPAARAVLANIISQSDVRRREACEQASRLSEAEAASVFSTLAEQVKQQEDLSNEKSVLDSLFELVQVRTELCSQLVAVLEHLAESVLSSAVVPKLVRTTKDNEAYIAAYALLERWSKNTVNPALATAAKSRLDRIAENTNGS